MVVSIITFTEAFLEIFVNFSSKVKISVSFHLVYLIIVNCQISSLLRGHYHKSGAREHFWQIHAVTVISDSFYGF